MERLTEKDFEQVYALMKMSFIDDELRPYEEQKALFKEPLYHMYAKRDHSNQEIKAFIAIWTFEQFVFIDYFAVHPAYRNQGLGKVILRELGEMTHQNICLEIEKPIDELTNRRRHFYERNHFIYCDYPYQQPPIARGNRPVNLSLMSSQSINNKCDFENIKATIYKYAYERFN